MVRLFSLLSAVFLFSTAFGQHDAQRNAMWKIGQEDPAAFLKEFTNPKVDAGMHETYMVNILRLLAHDEVDDAMVVAKDALEAGLPPEHLLAGPRDLLSKLSGQPGFDELPGIAEVAPVIHGPMLGNLTDDGVSVWVRTRDPERLKLVIDGGGATSGVSTVESDHTAELTISGLEANTYYTGKIVREGDEETVLGFVDFTTRSPVGEPGKFKVAFGGGAGYVPEWEYMWDTIAAFEPNALLMLGDNVYIDDPESQWTQDYCYHRRQSRSEWRRLVSVVPVYSIYDDHDFGDKDCIPGPEIEKPAWKRPVWETFCQNWVNPGYGGGEEQPGCWYSFSIADVDFFMLDGRYYRDLKGGSMLGPVQKAWLKEALKASDATFKLLVSPVPFTPGIKPGSKDPWDGYPEEREEIFSLLEEEEIEGVFLVAADRHRTDLRKNKRENGYPLYEFESSRLTNRHVHNIPQTPGLIWGYRDTCSFGLMEFDTTQDDPRVTMRCIDIDGVERESFVLKRSELGFGE